jgi:hypothetical protein
MGMKVQHTEGVLFLARINLHATGKYAYIVVLITKCLQSSINNYYDIDLFPYYYNISEIV